MLHPDDDDCRKERPKQELICDFHLSLQQSNNLLEGNQTTRENYAIQLAVPPPEEEVAKLTLKRLARGREVSANWNVIQGIFTVVQDVEESGITIPSYVTGVWMRACASEWEAADNDDDCDLNLTLREQRSIVIIIFSTTVVVVTIREIVW